MKKMKRFASLVVVGALSTTLALAQASGSFNASGTNAACAIGVGGEFNGGASVNLLTTTIQTSSGSGVTLLIRPSLVTGLYTNTRLDTTLSDVTADVGIEVCLSIDGSTQGILSAPCVVYDQRFQEVSTNLFGVIEGCAVEGADCNFNLILSTLSAHSFDFVAQVPQGEHVIEARWRTIGQDDGHQGHSHVASCVGPGVLTVVQTKVFQQNGEISFPN